MNSPSLFSFFATFLIFLRTATALSLLVPLYVYPGTHHSAWKPLLDSIEDNPHIQYNVIINPNSGPGSDHYPDANFKAGLQVLNAFSNVRTLGYVDTSLAKRDIKIVNREIDSYANWASYKNGNITVQGIFFDNVSTTDSQSVYHYYERLGDYTHSHDNNIPYVIFNPGIPAPAQLYGYCDTMVEFEGAYISYNTKFSFNDLPRSSKLRGQSAVILNNLPLNGADVGALVQKMGSEGMGMTYVTTDCCYSQLNGGVLKLLAAAVTGVDRGPFLTLQHA